MELIYSALLGLLQGATEFLPVSSSGHLVLAESFFHVEEASLTFDVALHMGTLLAVIIFFRQDLLAMLSAVCRIKSRSPEDLVNRRLALFLSIATVPAVVAGLLLEDLVETTFRYPGLVSVTLILFGLLLLWSDKKGSQTREFTDLGFKDILIIGFAQALAIIPGVSRSGITMTAGLFRSLDRPAVARFSFLMSTPIILGAGMYNLLKIMGQGLTDGQISFFLTGFTVSAISGYLFILFLMNYIRTRSFAVFAYYRFALAGLILCKLYLF